MSTSGVSGKNPNCSIKISGKKTKAKPLILLSKMYLIEQMKNLKCLSSTIDSYEWNVKNETLFEILFLYKLNKLIKML